MRLANKVSLITGAGAGMGYAAAHMFAREGSAIAVVDVDETTGNAAAESVRAAGGTPRSSTAISQSQRAWKR